MFRKKQAKMMGTGKRKVFRTVGNLRRILRRSEGNVQEKPEHVTARTDSHRRTSTTELCSGSSRTNENAEGRNSHTSVHQTDFSVNNIATQDSVQ